LLDTKAELEITRRQPPQAAAVPRRKIALSFKKLKIGARRNKICKGNFSARLCSDEQGGGSTLAARKQKFSP